MSEGHTIHALALRLKATGMRDGVHSTSPNGSFPEAHLFDTASIPDDGVDVVGKNLFLTLAPDAVVHIHLGMFGKMSVRQHGRKNPATPPTDLPVRGTIHWRLTTVTHRIDLTRPLRCTVLTADERDQVYAALGPDPLRPDADPHRAWALITASTRSVAELMMDQKIIAGIGNVYRAEILWLAGVDPFLPGHAVPSAAFEAIWAWARYLMPIGVAAGRILTHPHDIARARELRGTITGWWRYPDRPTFYTYLRQGRACRRCGHTIQDCQIAGRRLFWCPCCQAPRAAATTSESLASGNMGTHDATRVTDAAADHVAQVPAPRHQSVRIGGSETFDNPA